MSGHNKWSKIAGKKGIADAKRSAVFTRFAKAITVAAREGGADTSMNFKLRMAVEQAKGANMPSDNVERAIKRGSGEDDGGIMEAGLYEAYGPGGVGIVIETLSDNKNRTASEVQFALKKVGATPAEHGSVLFNFEQKAVVVIASTSPVIANGSEAISTDDLDLHLIDAGADDIDRSEDGIVIAGPKELFQKLVEAVEAAGLKPDEAGLEFVPKAAMAKDEETRAKVERIVEVLENLDDVQAVYTSLSS